MVTVKVAISRKARFNMVFLSIFFSFCEQLMETFGIVSTNAKITVNGVPLMLMMSHTVLMYCQQKKHYGYIVHKWNKICLFLFTEKKNVFTFYFFGSILVDDDDGSIEGWLYCFKRVYLNLKLLKIVLVRNGYRY